MQPDWVFHDTAYQYFYHNIALINPDPHTALADIYLRHSLRGELFDSEYKTDDDIKRRLRDYPSFLVISLSIGATRRV
jgi:hypothetical protein